jgi:hypothetical protein
VELHVDGGRAHADAGDLGLEAKMVALIGLDAEGYAVGARLDVLREKQQRHPLELQDNLRNPSRQVLPGPEVEGYPLPAPVVDVELHGDVGGGPGITGHPGLIPVPLILAPDVILRGDGSQGLQDLDLLIAQRLGIEGHRRLHCDQGEQLEHVTLHHVPDNALDIVVAGAVLHSNALSHRDLHVIHVVAVPQGLEDGVGEAEGEDVLHGLLAQVVVDPVHLGLVEYSVDGPVEGPGALQVPPRVFRL